MADASQPHKGRLFGHTFNMIIFLDFDGVLHPAPSGEHGLFCHLDRFEAVLREFPFVKVVISSSWREGYPEDIVIGIFSEDIQRRILGITPLGDGVPPFPRHAEIQAWLSETAYRGSWIALDDAKNEFPKNCEQLLLCQTTIGFDDGVAEQLRVLLAVHQSQLLGR